MAEQGAFASTESRERDLKEIKRQLEAYDYVRFTLVDIVGRTKAKVVPARSAYDFIESGIPFYSGILLIGSNCELIFPQELADINYRNIKMMPVLETFHSVSWLGDGKYKTAEIFVEHGDSSDIDKMFRLACPRVLATNQLKRLEELGYSMKSGMEWEHFLLHKDTEEPVFNKWIEFHSTLLHADFEDWFVDVDQKLHQAGVNIHTMQTEYAMGQFEFNSSPESGIKGADSNVIMKQCLKEMAAKKGYQANFMAKISDSQLGSGAHFSFSIWNNKTGSNAFYDENDPDNLSAMARHFVAGVLKHAPALTALCCPTTNCYQRLHKPWTPDLINWGIDDRFALLRVKNDGIKGTYMENRIPSPLANPYLIMAGTLAAGLDGVINKLSCPEPSLKTDVPKLQHSLEESLEALEKDQVMVDALGERFVRWFVLIKKEADLKAIEGVEDIHEKYAIERKNYGRTC